MLLHVEHLTLSILHPTSFCAYSQVHVCSYAFPVCASGAHWAAICYVWACVVTVKAYLGDLGVCTAAVSCGGMHPSALWRGALLPQGALLLLYTPAALKPGVRLQTHPAAVSQCVALIQVGWWGKRRGKKKLHDKKRKREWGLGELLWLQFVRGY